MRLFNVRCDQEKAELLADAIAAERAREKAWLRQRRDELAVRVRAERLTAGQRGAAERAITAELEQLRIDGQLRGTRSAYLAPVVRDLLAERGWNRRFKPVPARRRGRPWGASDQGFQGRVGVYLPDDLADQVERACYAVSAPALAKLERWHDRHGDHWRGHLHSPDRARTGQGPSTTDLATKQRLADQVWNPARFLRDAIDKALQMTEK